MTESSLREHALRLLARREHTRTGLARKLAAQAEVTCGSVEEINAVLDDLVSRGLLSDARYAEMRVHARGARFGNARLAQELRAAGVRDETIGDALAETGDELARAKEVWRRKYGSAGLPADASAHARQTNFLMRRGFSGETIRRVLRGGHEDD